MKFLSVLLLTMIILAAFPVSAAQAQSPCLEPLLISPELDFAGDLDFSGDYVAWTGGVLEGDHEGHEHGQKDIFLYDLSSGTLTNLTRTEHDEDGSQTNGTHVIWSSQGQSGTDIYLYDIAAGTTTNISNHPGEDKNPVLGEAYVAWEHVDDNGEHIWLHDIASHTTSIRTGGISDQNREPSLGGNKLVWRSKVDGKWHIYLYDLANGGVPRNISEDIARNNKMPVTNGSVVVWYGQPDLEDGTSEDYEIWLYDIPSATARNISQDEANQDTFPTLSENRLAWTTNVGEEFLDPEVMLYDIATSIRLNVSQNPGSREILSDLGERVITWTTVQDSQEIMLYRIGDRDPIQITTTRDVTEYLPHMQGDFLVWGARWYEEHDAAGVMLTRCIFE